MATFKIEWENDIYKAIDPLEAVKACYEDIKNGESYQHEEDENDD